MTKLTVVEVSSSARGGGAEGVAMSLRRGLRERGHAGYMVVGSNLSHDPEALVIPDDTAGSLWARAVNGTAHWLDPAVGRIRGAWRVQRLLRTVQYPRRLLDWYRGRENFDYPGTSRIAELPPKLPDLIHCHNLHGYYFDLRQLPALSARFPLAVTLHDEWMLTGHCAYTQGCERWRDGCGACPDLSTYPPIRKDATAENWTAKRDIYAASHLYIGAPSQWLMDRAKASMLAVASRGERVIHNGVDRAVFYAADCMAARRRIGLPERAFVLVFAANMARRNPFKDYATIASAVRRAAAALAKREMLLIVVGDDGPSEREGKLEIRPVPYTRDAAEMASYYQAADVYVHAAKADNFPLTVLEALACGTPVVATAVGGIPEQVKSPEAAPGGWQSAKSFRKESATGVLTPPSDADAMAQAIVALASDPGLCRHLSHNAALDAADRFDLDRQIDETIDWYNEIIEDHNGRSAGSVSACAGGYG